MQAHAIHWHVIHTRIKTCQTVRFYFARDAIDALSTFTKYAADPGPDYVLLFLSSLLKLKEKSRSNQPRRVSVQSLHHVKRLAEFDATLHTSIVTTW